ncbi:maltose O-acetyltransferase [[Clostridium] sordellii]|uniref:sugar O-acetyltransferase n=1 Tax=Paraclostridium sordellii TaxID=1505 RepID=UPI0005EA2FEC|nr:sugar O-acetyltransferase [Paeniclostridium sordellii]MDU2686546.1 sugar O-acetyltransferase [Paeniclostridium sordellii]MDU6249941.1 sugar O-acetyltransferase [Paeniclostridium sordellii]MVO70312.1 maltose O-acetyltransferase [Paeniclostridium sordellii]RGX06210.1 sugar O-acetyltransferase [Paeniclostridium sordellii]CEN89266.1 maltose O-acetyltransferase [[Clostridium] sordellii] [Paeniclostridium sordellii]
MTEKEKMLSGKAYIASDEELVKERKYARKITRLFNQTTEEDDYERVILLKKLFGATGENIYIEPSFKCDYGSNIYIGDNFYANFNCIMLDVCEIKIGKNVMLAPNVQIYTAYHPIDAKLRNSGIEYGASVTIGDNVWIGGGAIINPGVNIGDNVVIGSGSVVTKDIPANCVAVGNPCKIIKTL